MNKTRSLYLLSIILVSALITSGCASSDEKKSEAVKSRSDHKDRGVSPIGLTKSPASPISPADASRTTLSRPKVVKVQEFGKKQGNKKYFDVVDERTQTMESLSPTVDESARPTRVVTFDNNTVQKDYPIRFGSAWDRALEALLELPLTTVDRSSGVIITSWIYDDKDNPSEFLSLNPFSSSDVKVRYKYTVRILDRGSFTQIKVIPFAQTLKSSTWTQAKTDIVVTNSLFERIELELRTPLTTDRF